MSFQSRLEKDLADTISKIMNQNSGLGHMEAIELAKQRILAGLPENPPTEGCPINDLPPELLAYIFQIGVDEDENSEYDEDSEAEEMEVFDADESVDLAEGWEDADSSEDELDLITSIHRPRKGKHREVEIDDVSMDDGDSDEESVEEYYPPFQTLISHVCKHWRAVALEAPSLWTKVAFYKGLNLDRPRAWIERSKTRPLDIQINCQCPDYYEPSDEEHQTLNKSTSLEPSQFERDEDFPLITKRELTNILELITPHVSRWKSIEMEVSFYSYMYIFLQRLSLCPPAPLLEAIGLHHYEGVEDYEEFDSFHPQELKGSFQLFSGEAPKLTHVQFWGVHLDWDACLPMLSGLESLELSYHAKDVRPSFDTFVSILRNSPNLAALTLNTSGPTGDPVKDWPPDIIECPSVRDLVLWYLEVEYVCPLLKVISFPNLRDLSMDLTEGDFTPFAKQLSENAPGYSRSLLSGLENLKIAGFPCDHFSMDKMLSQLANLQHFNINCNSDEEAEFFEKLMNPVPSTSPSTTSLLANSTQEPLSGKVTLYCPNLKVMTVRGYDSARVREFVTKRKEAGYPLKKVLMSEDDEVDQADEDWFKENLDSFEVFEPSSEDDLSITEEEDEEW